ncbi:uncharacterized protein LOC129595662 [Paramacrobiotus metropolitanus]|uniref:uncharacterized protein LOC129595662 n=1 Tax=Paramacrobiotus metropolitanus TaxID=2943436 RepID=UPI0024464E17|nr:uncharacterized protein LOC129595662 [Paramacrobiotus metropolitanus]
MTPPYNHLGTAPRLHNAAPVLTFGIMQLIFGAALIISDIVSFSTTVDHAIIFSCAGSGFYTGIFFVITGAFGIASGRPLPMGRSAVERRCYLITSMVMSILSTISSITMTVAFTILLVFLQTGVFDFNCQGFYCPFGGWYRDVGNALLSANLAFQFMAFVASLGQSIAAGINMCKLPSQGTTVQYVVTQAPPVSPGFYPGGPAAVYNMPYGQPVMVVNPSGFAGPTGNPVQAPTPQKF